MGHLDVHLLRCSAHSLGLRRCREPRSVEGSTKQHSLTSTHTAHTHAELLTLSVHPAESQFPATYSCRRAAVQRCPAEPTHSSHHGWDMARIKRCLSHSTLAVTFLGSMVAMAGLSHSFLHHTYSISPPFSIQALLCYWWLSADKISWAASFSRTGKALDNNIMPHWLASHKCVRLTLILFPGSSLFSFPPTPSLKENKSHWNLF